MIDQNYFRTPDLQTRLESAGAGDEFAMTDYAFIEMFKSPEWELISRKTLAAIEDHPEHIVVCYPPSHILQMELANRVPTTGGDDLVDGELTDRMRLYLRELASVGQHGPRHAIVSSLIGSAQATIATQQQNHLTNLRVLQKGARAWKRLLRRPVLSDLRGGRMPDQTRALLAIIIASESARTLLLEHGATEQQANDFLADDSFLLRTQVSFNLLAISWVERGGIDNLRAEIATNEFMDIDYALFGSYCDGVLTREPTVARHHSLLVTALPLIKCDPIERTSANGSDDGSTTK